jgi:hypothetical protein
MPWLRSAITALVTLTAAPAAPPTPPPPPLERLEDRQRQFVTRCEDERHGLVLLTVKDDHVTLSVTCVRLKFILLEGPE